MESNNSGSQVPLPEGAQDIKEIPRWMKFGPIAWCNRCSRKHPRRMCYLMPGVFISKAMNPVPCLRNAPPEFRNDN